MTRIVSPSPSVWNISHSLGAGAVVVLCGYLAPYDWRLCFFVPDAAFMLFGASIVAGTLLFALCWPAKAHGYP